MQSTLEHFTIKNAMVFATGGNSSALFFLWSGKVRYVECVCVVCMTSQLAMSVYMATPFNQTWHTQIRKQTRQDDFGRIASSAARQMSLQMTNADNRH